MVRRCESGRPGKTITREEHRMSAEVTIQFEGVNKTRLLDDNKPKDWETTLSDTCLTHFASCVFVLPWRQTLIFIYRIELANLQEWVYYWA